MKVAFVDVAVFEGHAYVVNTEDGPATTRNCFAAVTLADGREFVHFQGFPQRWRADQMVERVRAVGEVDLAHWTQLEPRMSLEDRFALYGEREDEVRRGFRSEADMYHGID